MGLSLTIGDLHLYQSAFEIEAQRNERTAFGTEPLMQFQDLFFMHQQPPGLLDLVVEAVPEIICRDMDIVKQKLSLFDFGKPFIELDRPGPAAFDFGAGQLDTRFKFFDHIVIVKCFAVGCQGWIRSSFFCHFLLSPQEISGPFDKFFVLGSVVFRTGCGEFFQKFSLFFGKIHRSFHDDLDMQITSAHTPAQRGRTFALEPEDLSMLGAGRDIQFGLAGNRRHLHRTAVGGNGKRDRNLARKIIAVTFKYRIAPDVDEKGISTASG